MHEDDDRIAGDLVLDRVLAGVLLDLNALVGVDAEAFAEALARPRPAERPPLFGDGAAAPRIARLTIKFLREKLEEAA